MFNTSDPARRTGSVGEETAAQVIIDVLDKSFDLVIMNPPFTRATNHEGSHADVVNPAFAAFNANKADMDDMGKRLNQLGRNSSYHGNAGIASAFTALAQRKLKPGGVLALVLPLSAAAGLSWRGFRDMLEQDYTDLTVVSIAADGGDMSFSSDTGMAECLVIARKSKAGVPPGRRAHFASLKRRPSGLAQTAAIARSFATSDTVRTIEDGPYGGTRLTVGDELTGELITASVGDSWGSVRLGDFSLAQSAFALTHSKLWLPGHFNSVTLKVADLGKIGKLGLVDRDITGPPPRGSFKLIAGSSTATYPALWNHDAKRETKIVCDPDSQLEVRTNMEDKAAEVWASASRTHASRGFRFNSQPLGVAFY